MVFDAVLEMIKMTVAFILGVQCTYAACLILLGDTLMEQYEAGAVSNPQSIFSKIYNFIILLFLSMGPYLYKKRVQKFNWFLKRLLFLPWVVLLIISSLLFILH